MQSALPPPPRIRRSNSCTAAASTSAPFPVSRIASASSAAPPSTESSSWSPAQAASSFQDVSLLGSFPSSYAPPQGRALHFADLDEKDDDDDDDGNDGDNQRQHERSEPHDVSTEDESERPERARGKSGGARRRRGSADVGVPELSKAQKAGCFNYIKRRHSIALAFASDAPVLEGDAGATSGSNWEPAKTKHGVSLFRSKRSRCEVRAVTRVNASVKNVMALLATGDSSESFARAQRVLLGADSVLEARVLAQCVPASASRYFHCGLKHLALKNPFGLAPLDLVFLDYTDVTATADGRLLGYRIMESIRVPEVRSSPKYVRASLRCEVYVVRETREPGVVEVTFASHLDPKSKHSSARRSHWLEAAAARLANLRAYAEKASFAHRLRLEAPARAQSRASCSVCAAGFSFLRKRHSCRLCGDVACGRCSRKLPVLVDTVTTRVRVCVRCMLDSRHDPDELGRSQFGAGAAARRGSVGNATFIAYDELDQQELEQRSCSPPRVRGELRSA